MKNLKALWELLCIIVLGVPMMLVGYFGTFVVFGLITGHRLYMEWHQPKPNSNKTSP